MFQSLILEVEQKSWFRRGLRYARRGTPLSGEDVAAWRELIEELDKQWSLYLNNAYLMMASDPGELSDDAKRGWMKVLDEMKADWATRTKPAMLAVGSEKKLESDSLQVLGGLTAMLDQIMLNLVRDNSVWRAVERDALFRMFERLQVSTNEQLKAESLGVRGFLQLYEQPKVYRGKLITVRGVARMAYHERARKNALGIEGYYVFWIKPNGGPDSPIVIYSLELPPGFPKLKDRDVDRGTTVLSEEVEFTGFFFKRWAYRARDGINTAPLVIAKGPDWEGPTAAAASDDSPTYLALTTTAVLTALLGLAIAIFVYYQSRATSPADAHRAVLEESEAKTLEKMEVEPGVIEALQRLEQSVSNGSKPPSESP